MYRNTNSHNLQVKSWKVCWTILTQEGENRTSTLTNNYLPRLWQRNNGNVLPTTLRFRKQKPFKVAFFVANTPTDDSYSSCTWPAFPTFWYTNPDCTAACKDVSYLQKADEGKNDASTESQENRYTKSSGSVNITIRDGVEAHIK